MCGILVWLKKNDKINQTLFKESLKLINHRGPDSQNYTCIIKIVKFLS